MKRKSDHNIDSSAKSRLYLGYWGALVSDWVNPPVFIMKYKLKHQKVSEGRVGHTQNLNPGRQKAKKKKKSMSACRHQLKEVKPRPVTYFYPRAP